MAKQLRNRRPAVRTPLSDRIYQLLDGRKQPWLTGKSGVKKSKIVDILRGTATDFYAGEAILIAKAFKTTVEEMYSGVSLDYLRDESNDKAVSSPPRRPHPSSDVVIIKGLVNADIKPQRETDDHKRRTKPKHPPRRKGGV